MKFLFWLLALFTVAVTLALTAKNPGYVLLVYPPYRIELSLTLFILGFLTLLALTYFSLRLVIAALRLPNYVRTFREQRALSKGRVAMMDALTAFFEGRYAEAELPLQALNLLKELNPSGKHKHIGALQLELKAQQQAYNWDGVLDVVSQLEKRSAIGTVVATQMRQQAWMEKLRAQTQDLKVLQLLWKSVPDEFKRRSKIAAMAASSFMKFQDCLSAREIISDSLIAQWDSELVTLYGDCKDTNNADQIEQAEKWLKNHNDDPGLLLALGKLCLHRELWGKAQNYLDASNSLKPSRAAYTALAQLADKLQKHEDATRYSQLAMGLD